MALFKRGKKDEVQKAPQQATKPVSAPTAPKTAEKKSAAPAKPATTTSKTPSSRASHVFIKPMITEKAAHLAESGKYVFAVRTDMNKIDVKKAIKELYGVEPADVNMIRMQGKKVRFGRLQGQRKGWKKAIVTLPAGSSIEVYEGV